MFPNCVENSETRYLMFPYFSTFCVSSLLILLSAQQQHGISIHSRKSALVELGRFTLFVNDDHCSRGGVSCTWKSLFHDSCWTCAAIGQVGFEFFLLVPLV